MIDLTDKTLVFYHIPKTAGMSLQIALLHEFQQREGVEVVVINNDQQRPPELAHTRVKAKHESYRGIFGPNKELLCALGHEAFYACFWTDRPCIYLTVLRDPISRIVSMFNYIRGKGVVADNLGVNEVFGSDEFWNTYMTKNAFIKSANWYHWYSNLYCRALSPYGHFMTIREGQDKEASKTCFELNYDKAMTHSPIADTDMFEESYMVVGNRQIAIKHPKTGEVKFCPIYIGISERLNEFLTWVSETFNIQIPEETPYTNVGNYNRDELNQDARRKLLRHNQYDVELYKLARLQFDQKVKI